MRDRSCVTQVRAAKTGSDSSLSCAHFRIQTEDDNWCTAYRINGYSYNSELMVAVEDLDDEAIYLAKPPELQRQEYENEVDGDITWTYVDVNERQGSDGVETVNQIIVPPFLLPDGVYKGRKVRAVRDIAGGTGVFKSDGTELRWQITGSYAWAKKKT